MTTKPNDNYPDHRKTLRLGRTITPEEKTKATN